MGMETGFGIGNQHGRQQGLLAVSFKQRATQISRFCNKDFMSPNMWGSPCSTRCELPCTWPRFRCELLWKWIYVCLLNNWKCQSRTEANERVPRELFTKRGLTSGATLSNTKVSTQKWKDKKKKAVNSDFQAFCWHLEFFYSLFIAF